MNFNLILRRFKRLVDHYFWHDKLVFVSFIISVVICLAHWIFLLIKLRSLEIIIPLHYNVYFGVDLIGHKNELLKIPALAVLILIINVFLAFKIYKHERIGAYFLLIANCLSQTFLLLATILIINL